MLPRTQNASNTNRTDTVIEKMSHYFLGYIMSDLCFGLTRPFCIPGLPLHEVCLNVHGCALSILRQQNDQHGQAAMTMLMATISAVPCKNWCRVSWTCNADFLKLLPGGRRFVRSVENDSGAPGICCQVKTQCFITKSSTAWKTLQKWTDSP